jgi:hypothetical protein
MVFATNVVIPKALNLKIIFATNVKTPKLV